jgi:sugar (pentulose or hexulose) kinase
MHLIINLGLKSIRSIIFDNNGCQVYSKSYSVHTSIQGNIVEQDASEYYRLLILLLDDLESNSGLISKIMSVTSTTSSSCIFGMKENGTPTTKVMMVSDKRSEKYVNIVINKKEYLEIREEERPVCTSASLIPKLLWQRENNPSTYDETDYWLGIGDYLNFLFTGSIISDTLNASKYFYCSGNYFESVINSLGLQVNKLPKVYPIGKIFNLDLRALGSYSFNKECVYVLTTYDAICAVVGSSDGSDSNACDVSGTVTSVRIINSISTSVSSSSVLLSQRLDILNKTIIGSSNNLGGGIIEWYKQSFFSNIAENKVYGLMENLASNVSIGANGIIFNPYLLGERSPIKLVNGFGSFIGLNRNTSINDFTRAVFESCGYTTKGLFDLIEQDTNLEIKSLSVSGGLARFDLINQIKADVLNVPVRILENFESTSIGAYLLAMQSLGLVEYNLDSIKEIVKIRKILYPSSSSHKIYNEYYKIYKQMSDALHPIYDLHNKLKEKFTMQSENALIQNL